MNVSKTYSIEDIYKYVSGTDVSAISENITSYSFYPRSSITPSFSTDGTNITITAPNSSNLWQRGDLSFLDGLDNFQMSMILKGGYLGFQLNNESTLYLFTSESRWIQTATNTGEWNATNIQTLSTSTEYILEITVNGTSVTLKIYNVDGTLLTSTVKTMTTTMNRFGFAWHKRETSKFRDLKIKTL